MQRLERRSRKGPSILDDSAVRQEDLSPRHARERPLDNSGPFLHRDNLITFHVRQLCYASTGPNDFNRVDSGTLTESKVDSGILCGLVTHAALSLIVEDEITG